MFPCHGPALIHCLKAEKEHFEAKQKETFHENATVGEDQFAEKRRLLLMEADKDDSDDDSDEDSEDRYL